MWDELLLFVAVGFAAQLIDGALGMAYGVSATTALLGFGIPPATASASVHAAEVFTTGASGYAHWRLGNVSLKLFRRLAVPGMAGGAVGAYLLSNVPGEVIRPIVNAYLLLMGFVILWKAIRNTSRNANPPDKVACLGLIGGFLDAIGGGGWGALVTSSLLGHGTVPRIVIGSVNLAEFFVTATITSTFIFTIGLELWPVIAGLILGGVTAAPFAAYVTARVPDRPLMILVGVMICLLSLRGILQTIG
jgi:uncharacterized membrane protein YfcA